MFITCDLIKTLQITFETAEELNILKRIVGLTTTIPRALRADAKVPARQILQQLQDALDRLDT